MDVRGCDFHYRSVDELRNYPCPNEAGARRPNSGARGITFTCVGREDARTSEGLRSEEGAEHLNCEHRTARRVESRLRRETRGAHGR
jgi:hypothetical protein